MEVKATELDELGRLVDKADNYLMYGTGGGMAKLPAAMRIDALTTGLKEIRNWIKRVYIANGGEDRWDQ